MTTSLILLVLSLGLSESIEPRLPVDPGMIYTVSFPYEGTKVGIDWRDRQIVVERTCRKTPDTGRLSCQKATLEWLAAECAYYARKSRLTSVQKDMQKAVCSGRENLQQMLAARAVARN